MNTVFDKTDQPDARSADGPRSAVKKVTRILIVVGIALAGAFIFTARVNPTRVDYISYWSSAKLVVHRADPYSAAGVFSLEKPLGFLPSRPLIMRNPPWALFLVAPLGFVGPRLGLALWVIALAACIIGSVHLLNPRSRDNPLALLFAPAIACIGSGQSSPFLLLGFALFLYFHQRRPYLAGAALLLMAIKPHLFLVFWAVLLAESICRRKFRILAGGTAALIITSAFALCIDKNVFSHYLVMLRSAQLSHKLLPTTSMMFRIMIDPNAFWLLYVPSSLAILWGVWYYWRNRDVWDWRAHGMLLMLVSIATSPYGFITDEIVLLPTIIFALNFPGRRRFSGWILLLINCVAALIYTAAPDPLTTPVLVWTPIAWLAWFLYTTKMPIRGNKGSPAQLPETVLE